MRMGNLIFTCSSSSKGTPRAQRTDSSTWSPHLDQHISFRSSRVLNQFQTSSPIWERTEPPSNGESSLSMEDLQEGVNRQPMTLTPQHLTQAVSQRLLESLRN
ncbi:AC4 protein [Tomato leaf curl Patna virus [Tobacco]]|nr:AC4 protein [Tomato leaf curl Patna virus [Tobacco]]